MTHSIFKPLLLVGIAALACSACSTVDRLENIGKNPAISPISNPTAVPGYQPVTMPMPAAPPPATHLTNSLWSTGARSFFHDPRATHIGDLLTVNIAIADTAQLSDTTARSRANSDNAGASNFFGLESSLTKLLPNTDPTKLVNLNSATSNSGTGSVNRSETINLTLAAVVTQVLPNGNLVINGHQEVRVNTELRDLQINGIVRTEDITSANTVDLSQIAEARLSYGGRGQITDVQQPPLGQQLYDILMPF